MEYEHDIVIEQGVKKKITYCIHNDVKTIDSEEWFNEKGKRHRVDGPAWITYRAGRKYKESWQYNDLCHREGDLPAETYYNPITGVLVIERWCYNGVGFRTSGLATDIYYTNGIKTEEEWDTDMRPHDGDLPNRVHYSGTGEKHAEMWADDELHRADGPAMITYNTNGEITGRFWYRHDEFGGDVLAYVELADIANYRATHVCKTLHGFRDAVKGPLARELLRPLPIPIRDEIYDHYCLQ